MRIVWKNRMNNWKSDQNIDCIIIYWQINERYLLREDMKSFKISVISDIFLALLSIAFEYWKWIVEKWEIEICFELQNAITLDFSLNILNRMCKIFCLLLIYKMKNFFILMFKNYFSVIFEYIWYSFLYK